jgi:glycosyltransferase involved in cell wall biosynthesis
MGRRVRVRISLLMPCFNAGEYLEEAIRSVLDQDYCDWELLVQDAGSSDGSQDRLRSCASADARIKVIVEPDQGQSDALNRALALASGVVVGWVNADDLLLPGALASVAAQYAESRSIIYGDWAIVGAQNQVIREYTVTSWKANRFQLHGCYIFSGAIFWPRQLLSEAGGWRNDLHYCMDLDLVLRLSGQPASHAGRPLAALRWHAAAKSSQHGGRFRKEAWRVRRAHMHSPSSTLRLLRATAVMSLSSVTTKFRFGRWYSRFRAGKRW